MLSHEYLAVKYSQVRRNELMQERQQDRLVHEAHEDKSHNWLRTVRRPRRRS